MVNFYNIFFGIQTALAVVSLLCSMLMTWLLLHTSKYHIKDMPDYILVLLIISIAQAVYDCGIIIYSAAPQSNNIAHEIGLCIESITLFILLWTNVMSFLVGYLVTYTTRKAFNLRPFIPALLIGTSSLFITFMIPLIVYWEYINSGDNSIQFRIFLAYLIVMASAISFNFITISASMVHLYHLGIKRTSVIWGKLERMMYYPVVQVVIKLPAIIYQWEYASVTHSYTESDASLGQTVLLFIVSVFMPLGGILYLAIYLYEEIGAWDILMKVIYKTIGWDYVAPPRVNRYTSNATIDKEESVAASTMTMEVGTTEESQLEGDKGDIVITNVTPDLEDLENHYAEELAQNFSGIRNPLVEVQALPTN